MKTAKRTLALLLTVCLLCSTLFTSAFAAGGAPEVETGVKVVDRIEVEDRVSNEKDDLESLDEDEAIEVQQRIDVLPTVEEFLDMNDEDQDTIYAEVGDLRDMLEGVDTDDLDTEKYDALMELFMPEAVTLDVTGAGTEADPYIVASEDDLKTAVGKGGYIQLSEDVKLTSMLTIAQQKTVVLDLNGKQITTDDNYSANYGILVYGELTTKDSGSNGGISIDNAAVKYLFANVGEITIESGTYSSTNAARVVLNNGIVNLNGGTLSSEKICVINATSGANFTMTDGVIEGGTWVVSNQNTATLNVEGGTIQGKGNSDSIVGIENNSFSTTDDTVCNFSGGTIKDVAYGITLYGPGTGTNGRNNKNEEVYNTSVLNFSGGEIKADAHGISTNASGGATAGNEINITGGVIDGGDDCGMYLPAIGVTNISGGTISGAQGIRIAAGELNITGGTIEGTAALTEDTDLISGGSGGTQGAIVVGKAGNSGYVGDIKVVVSKDAVVKNEVDDGAAIVVSDKNMANENYEDNSISVIVDGTAVTGDIIKVSNLTQGSTTSDGGDTTLTIQNAKVDGNIANKSVSGVTVKDTSITGSVTNENSGSTAVLGNSTIEDTENTTNSGSNVGGTLYIEGADNNTSVAVNENTAKLYTDLATAIAEANDGDTITLLAKEIVIGDNGANNNTGALNIDKNITINGNNATIKANDNFTAEKNVHLFNITSGAEVTIQNVTIDGNSKAKHGVNVWTAENAQPAKVTLDNVTVKNNRGYGVVSSGSELTVTNITTNDNAWGGINIDNTANDSNTFVMNSGTLNETYSIVIENAKKGDVDATIVDGTFNNVILQNVDATDADEAVLTIQGGTFKGEVAEIATSEGSDPAKNEPSALISVEGGSYANSVAEYAKNSGLNAELKKNDNNTTPYSYYNSVEDALKDAESGDTVTNLNPEEGETSEAVTVYAVTVTNDGETVDSAKVLSGDPYSLPAAPTKSGYKFQGWKAGSTTYSAGEEVPITADTTFTAQWKKKSSSSGSSSSSSSKTEINLDTGKNGDVSVSPKKPGKGDKVTITVEPDDGYILDTIKVTDEDGDKIKLTEKGENKYTFTMPSGEVTIETTFTKADSEDAPKFSFIDVSTGDWFAPAVDYVSAKGMMNGSNGYFSPYDSLTRGMIAQILYNLEGGTGSFAIAYPDVSASDWYANAVSWVSANGIMSGYGSGLFGANDSVTREQLALTLYSYAKVKGYNTSASAELTAFADGASTSEWAKPAMQWAVANGLFSGKTGNRLDPQGTATRAEVASILMRFCETIAK